MRSRQAFEPADLPKGRKAIGVRWVYAFKYNPDGSIIRGKEKARLVAQGFSQRPGWDFVENFAPTIRLSVIRAIFALVAAEDMECNSLDITTAFLNGHQRCILSSVSNVFSLSRDRYI